MLIISLQIIMIQYDETKKVQLLKFNNTFEVLTLEQAVTVI